MGAEGAWSGALLDMCAPSRLQHSNTCRCDTRVRWFVEHRWGDGKEGQAERTHRGEWERVLKKMPLATHEGSSCAAVGYELRVVGTPGLVYG